jgi:hypothetical protein
VIGHEDRSLAAHKDHAGRCIVKDPPVVVFAFHQGRFDLSAFGELVVQTPGFFPDLTLENRGPQENGRQDEADRNEDPQEYDDDLLPDVLPGIGREPAVMNGCVFSGFLEDLQSLVEL